MNLTVICALYFFEMIQTQGFFFFFLAVPAACRNLVLWPEIEPRATAMKAPSLNHWTAGEFPIGILKDFFNFYSTIVNLQCCVNFCYMAKGLIYIYAKSLQSCLTLRPHRRQPTRLPRPWNSPTHWSGLPFPSPMHESEKWKWSRSVVSDS